ncbi:MAG: HNH endonuclease signature motif containing protein [bacterium]|nr:HNH endonuclease signature motif containing protein [bacterium]
MAKNKKSKKSVSQMDLVKEFFLANPNRDIHVSEVVDWVRPKYQKINGSYARHPDKQVRDLGALQFLIKVRKGIYRYDPDLFKNKDFEYFTPEQKKIIFERDGYRCVMCGKGKKDGVELHIDHIKPKHLGGEATIENGQTLCARHNNLKKNLGQTETAKKMYIRLYALAKKGDSKSHKELQKFFTEILEVFERYDVNGHIEWKK